MGSTTPLISKVPFNPQLNPPLILTLGMEIAQSQGSFFCTPCTFTFDLALVTIQCQCEPIDFTLRELHFINYL